MKIYLKSFGCKVNTAEDQLILSKLAEHGYEYSENIENSDIILINSCAVTDIATEKVLSYLRNIDTDNGRRKIIVTGCVASDKNINLKKYNVDTVIHNSAKSDIVELILGNQDNISGFSDKQSILAGVANNSRYRTRAFFKIQDGCDAGCSYCIIPRVRGSSRSVDKMKLIDDFKRLVDNGSREIVVVGIHIGLYGREFGTDLYGLLHEFSKIKGDFRIRLSSLEVTEIDERLIELIADGGNKIAPHLHLPLQSGSDRILKLMNRHYCSDYYIEKVHECREKIKNLAVGCDVMVGFPSESDDDFKNTINCIKSAGVNFLHIFSYSDREGSVASTMGDKVSGSIKKERAKILQKIAGEQKSMYEAQFIGKNVRILAESGNRGHSDNYLLINVNQKVEKNRFYDVVVKTITDNKIYGDIF